MIDPRLEEKARKLTNTLRLQPLDQLVEWLKKEEHLSERQAMWVAQEALKPEPKAALKRAPNETLGDYWAKSLEAVRAHVRVSGKPLSPLADVGLMLGLSPKAVSQAFKQLAVEGLVKQVHKPGTPSYVKVWVRTEAAKTGTATVKGLG